MENAIGVCFQKRLELKCKREKGGSEGNATRRKKGTSGGGGKESRKRLVEKKI